MSEPKLAADAVTARKRLARDAERTARLLREYAGKLHRLADRLHAVTAPAVARSLFSFVSVPTQPDDVTRGIVAGLLLRRRAVIAGMVEDACRAASGMVDHGALPLAVKSELLLRLRETENALVEARGAAAVAQKVLSKYVDESLLADVPIPDLAAIERRRKVARDTADAQRPQPQPVG